MRQDGREHAERNASILHLRCRPTIHAVAFRLLLDLLGDVTPVVQPLPPSVVLADVGGSCRYFGGTPYELALQIRLRAAAHLGPDGLAIRIGIAPTRALAMMASGHTGTEGMRLVSADPDAIRAFVDPLPVKDLDGIGPAHAATLARFGLDTVGLLANTPLGTVQRILGARVGRRAYDRARGFDPRPIVPTALPASTSDQRLLDRDTLDPDLLHAEVLDTVVTIAARLRERHQVAGALTLTVSLAGGARIERTRTLAAPSAHTEDLRTAAIGMWTSLALERGRVRGIMLRADQLATANGVTEQLSLDGAREKLLRLEPVIDRANARFGTGAVVPATLANRRSG